MTTYSKRRRRQKANRKGNNAFGAMVKRDSFLLKRKKRPKTVDKKSGRVAIF